MIKKRRRGALLLFSPSGTGVSVCKQFAGNLPRPSANLAHVRGRCFELASAGARWQDHDGAITFGDLVGKLDMLRVACEKCGRKGRYAVARLIEQRGREAKVLDLLAEITADCPKKQAGNMSDQCAARCPDLPRVM